MQQTSLLLFVLGLLVADCGGRSGLDRLTPNVGGELSFGGAAATGGQVAAGGTTTPGGTTSTGGTHATGGLPATGGSQGGAASSAKTGGSSATGGATLVAADAGSGCTASFETLQSGTGLCVAKMATIAAPGGLSSYGIDVTEVTQGQYDAWLATHPPLPASTDINCAYVTSYATQGDGFWGTDADHHPVVAVDWCDAYEYCLGVGKRLCGAIGGGSVDYASGYLDANQSQWFRACTSGGTYAFPYGNSYESASCDGSHYGHWSLQTMAVGSLASCVTPTTGVYDLSGNVWEWEDCCQDEIGLAAHCRFRGGAFYDDFSYLACANDRSYYPRGNVDLGIGFRCCSQ